MKGLRTLATAAMIVSGAEAQTQNHCSINLLENIVNNCSSCHARERRGLDSPSVLESVRIGQRVIDMLGNYDYKFFHQHGRVCQSFADVINIIPRDYNQEAEAAIISNALNGGKDLIITESSDGVVQKLKHWLFENGVVSNPVKFAPTSQHYQNAVNNSNTIQEINQQEITPYNLR